MIPYNTIERGSPWVTPYQLKMVTKRSLYLGAYLGPQEELEAWVKPQVEAWAHWVRVLGKIARRNP